MATPINTQNNRDFGGDVVCCKYIRTGFNNPGVLSGTATSILANAPAQIVNSGSALTLTADSHLGVGINLNSATGAITLPAATGTGNTYVITVTTASTSATITTAGSDKIAGCAIICTTAGTGGAGGSSTWGIASGTTITMNGSTQGGVVGSQIFLTDVKAALWVVEANLLGTGTPVTPFS